jgi:hypothetical protein
MNSKRNSAWRWLAAVVIVHLAVSVIHGQAHAGAQVPLSPPATMFVYIVILAGPLVGLALTWPAAQIGAWMIAMTMMGSFVFGLINHFVLDSPDHVAHVDPQWRLLFTLTAVLLAVTEAVGLGLAIQVARGRRAALFAGRS